MLYHLRDAGFKGMQLFKLYCCYILSMIEYCSPVYHSLLNTGQGTALERLQRHALRVCFGYESPVEHWMQQFNISSLKDRRSRRCDAFLQKAASNPMFAPSWFPPREGVVRNLRKRRPIHETQAGTLRRFNSPLAFCAGGRTSLGSSWRPGSNPECPALLEGRLEKSENRCLNDIAVIFPRSHNIYRTSTL